MRIIILTGRFGMGHMTAAMAVRQQIEDSNRGAEVELIDFLDYISPRLAAKYYDFFRFLVDKGHRLYNMRYRLLENKKCNQKPEFSFYFNKFTARLIEERKPDLMISTLPMCSQLISAYKERTGSFLPLITCVTDITGHSEWINRNTTYYFVGTRSVAEKFIAKGVPADKILVSGVPVRQEFKQNGKHNEWSRKLLLMGGGLGMLPKMQEFYQGLEELSNAEITIITGKNHTLYQQLEGRYKNIKVLGYVHNIYDYMKESDLIITKPGGITTFEAIFAEVPILTFPPLLQQEIYNAQFIQEMGIGTVLMGNPGKWLQGMRDNLKEDSLKSYRANIREVRKQLQDQKLIQFIESAMDAGVRAASVRSSAGMTPYQLHEEEYGVHEAISFNL